MKVEFLTCCKAFLQVLITVAGNSAGKPVEENPAHLSKMNKEDRGWKEDPTGSVSMLF